MDTARLQPGCGCRQRGARALNAPAEAQLRLLDLQALDSALDRLAHRRRTLPEIEQIDALESRLSSIGDDVVVAETEDRDLAREQAKIEADVEQVGQRATRDQQRLDSGQVSTPRELEQLQSEIASLGRRRSDLEDQVLELMEQREAVQTRVTELTGERERLTTELTDAITRRDSAFLDIDKELAETVTRRAELAAALPGDLLNLYEKVRASAGGVGAAALSRGRCEGCHLQLNNVELAQIRQAPPDAVLRCEECRRILVRTSESGL